MIMYILLLNILTKKLNATVICLLFLIGVYELTDVYASFINKGLQYDLFVRTDVCVYVYVGLPCVV